MSKNNGSITSLDELLAINDCLIEKVFVEQWNTTVFLRRLTMKAHTLLEQYFVSVQGEAKVGTAPYFRETVVGLSLCNEDGQCLMESLEQCQALANMDSGVIKDLFEVADRLNGITDNAKEELKKKSETTLS